MMQGDTMPTWSPNWSDVVFDHQSAHDYAEACRRTGSELTRIRGQRELLARSAVIEWEGANRTRFDHEITRWDRQAESLANQLVTTARQVEAAAAEAQQTQAHRELLRQQWLDEDAAERTAASRLAE
jgi:uncharacterized protein YukE